MNFEEIMVMCEHIVFSVLHETSKEGLAKVYDLPITDDLFDRCVAIEIGNFYK
jgi:hypothetical protein